MAKCPLWPICRLNVLDTYAFGKISFPETRIMHRVLFIISNQS